MPAVDEHTDAPARRRPKAAPQGLSIDTLYLGEKLDAVEERVASLEAKAPSAKLLMGFITLIAVLFFTSQVYMVSLIATSRGVDVAPAAAASSEVIRAGTTTVVESAGVTTTVETKKTEDVPAAVEP
jgi:hypothetical protein